MSISQLKSKDLEVEELAPLISKQEDLISDP